MSVIRYISKCAFLLGELVKKGIKLKYRRSYLGILWSLIEPVISTIVLVIIFGTLFNTNTKTYPLYIIIGRLIFSFIIFLISLVVLVGVAIFCQVIPTWRILLFFPALILLFFLTVGCGTILCTLNVFFRDIEYIWNVLCMILMYMSAIFYYPEKILKSGFSWVLNINPIFHITSMARNAFLGNPIDMFGVLYSSAFVGCVLLVGGFFFYRMKDKFVLYL